MGVTGEVAGAVLRERARNGRGLLDPNPATNRVSPVVSVMTATEAATVTLTQGVSGAATTITNSVLVPPTDAALTFYGTNLSQYAGGSYYRWGGITTISSMPFSCEFMYYGQAFEVSMLGTGTRLRLWVNGKAYSLTPTEWPPADSAQYLWKIDLGSVDFWDIRIEGHFWYFGGIRREPTGTVWKTHRPRGPKVIVLGDSYTAGTGGKGLDNPATWLGYFMGWPDTWASGVGGTGYDNDGSGGTVKFQTRVQNDVIAQNPDIVVVCGGINDGTTNIAAASLLLFQTIKAGLPNAKLIATGPWQANGGISTAAIGVRDAIRTSMTSAKGHLFIDNVVATVSGGTTLSWVTGTGKSGSPTGSGNADNFIDTDGVHPVAAGHRYLGYRIASAIAAALPLPEF